MAAGWACFRTLRCSLYPVKALQSAWARPCVGSFTPNLITARYINKHWNPKWKRLRRLKVIKIDLPNYHEKDVEEMTEEEIRSKMKEKGIVPPRPWQERQFFISSTNAVFEPYVPPEGDGKVSTLSVPGAKQTLEFLGKKSKSMMALRKIRAFEEEFNLKEFALFAQDIYIKAHECMAKQDETAIQEYVTEKAYPEILHNTKCKTIRWKFIKSLEPPRVVHIRTTDVISKENVFAQITVRFHTQQVLAVYDRFGRLTYGSEILAKDVLEYVVFEKHMANQYGLWRLHDKIIPDWMPPKPPLPKTYRKVEPIQEEPETASELPVAAVPEDKTPPVAVA